MSDLYMLLYWSMSFEKRLASSKVFIEANVRSGVGAAK